MSETWFLMQEFKKATYFNWAMQMRNASLGWKDDLGTADSLSVYHDDVLELHFNQQHWRRLGENTLEKVLKAPEWLAEIIDETYKRTDSFIEFLDGFKKRDLHATSKEELASWFDQFENIRQKVHIYGVVGTILEFDHELFSKFLQKYITQQIKSTNANLSTSKVFSELTIFHKDTSIRKEEKGMMELVRVVQHTPGLSAVIQDGSNEEVLKSLETDYPEFGAKFESHYQNYRWIQYQHIGPAWDRDYFIDILRSILKQKIDTKTKIESYEEDVEKSQKKQEELFEKLEFDDYHREMFRLAQELSFIKALRNDSFFYGFYCVEPLLKEIGNRLDLSLSQVRTFLPGEAKEALLGGEYSADELNERSKYSVYAILDGKERMILGREAEKLRNKIQSLEPVVKESDEVVGTTAVVGKTQGKVKIVNEVEDINKMEQGNVLVSNATYPSLVPAMKKAAAIVTDLGGITSHAAIISRELNIPCVVGTKIATKIFKDGDFVEVDAEKGIVKKLE